MPHTQGRRAPRNTPEPCLKAADGKSRKRATNFGAFSASAETKDRKHKPKLQSKQQRSSSAASGDDFHVSRRSFGKITPSPREATHDTGSQRIAAKGTEASAECLPGQVSNLETNHTEGTVGHGKAPEALRTSKAAMSVKPTVSNCERASNSKAKSQTCAISKPEHPHKIPRSAQAKSVEGDAKSNSIVKSGAQVEVAAQGHGRDLQKGLEKTGQIMEGTVDRTSQLNIEVRALTKSNRSQTQMASPITPILASRPRRNLLRGRHMNFPTLEELKKREVDLP